MYHRVLPIHTARVGVPFELQLESNQTTGYSWTISNLPYFVRLVDEKYIPESHPAGWVGGGGKQIFTLIAEYPGDDVLSLVYATPWGNIGAYYDIRIIAVC